VEDSGLGVSYSEVLNDKPLPWQKEVDYSEQLAGGVELQNAPEKIQVASRQEAVDKIKEHFRNTLEDRFPHFAFHNVEHSKGVLGSAILFSDSVKLADPTIFEGKREILEVAASAHDSWQAWEVKGGLRQRNRGFVPQRAEKVVKDVLETGRKKQIKIPEYDHTHPEEFSIGNEEYSAYELIDKMTRYIIVADGRKENAFSNEEILEAVETIGGTYPSFVFNESFPVNVDPKNETSLDVSEITDLKSGLHISQPYAEKCWAARAIGTGDLWNHMGSTEGKLSLQAAMKEWEEFHIKFADKLKRADQTPDDRVEIAGSILDWLFMQEGTIAWQHLNFERFLATSPLLKTHPKADEIRTNIRNAFPLFKANAAYAREAYLTLESAFGDREYATFRRELATKGPDEISEEEKQKLTKLKIERDKRLKENFGENDIEDVEKTKERFEFFRKKVMQVELEDLN